MKPGSFIRRSRPEGDDRIRVSPQGGLENRILELLKMGLQRAMFPLTTAIADKRWPPLQHYYALTRKFS